MHNNKDKKINRNLRNNAFTQNNKKKIWIVDDEPDIGLIPKLALENNGYMVDYYYNSVPALYECNLIFMT